MNYIESSDMIPEVEVAGFILAGGASRRMGSDKALLDFRGRPLIEHIAESVAAVAGPVTIVGPPDRYANLRFPVIPDRHPGLGPLAGIEAALTASASDRNLIVACDMPDLKRELLDRLIGVRGGDCVLPQTPDGRVHPLCAIWHRRLLPAIQAALDARRLKVMDVLQSAEVIKVNVELLPNANTPADWLQVAH